MHKLDLQKIKQTGHIDFASLIWEKTLRNVLPSAAKQAVKYLTTFDGRELTGTVLHDKNYKDVFKTRQQILDGTKLLPPTEPILQPDSDSDSWLSKPWPVQDLQPTDPESKLPTTDPDPTDQEGVSDPGLPSVE